MTSQKKQRLLGVLLIQTREKFTQQNMQKFTKLSSKTIKYHSRDHLMEASHIEQANNSKGEIKHAVDICKVCTSVAHHWAETVMCVSMQCTIRWSQKWPKLPTEGYSSRKTVFYCYDPQITLQVYYFRSLSSPHPHKVRQVRSKNKSMLLTFYDYALYYRNWSSRPVS